MTRSTSIEVYHQIEAEGLLSKRRFEVYSCLYEHGPLTQREVTDRISNKYAAERSYTPRFAELESMAVIKPIGERLCSITGRQVLVWDVTNKLPKKIITESLPTKRELIEALCLQLEKMCKHLDKQGTSVPDRWHEWNQFSRNIIEQCNKHRRKTH